MKRRMVAMLLSVALGISYTPCYADASLLNSEAIQQDAAGVSVENPADEQNSLETVLGKTTEEKAAEKKSSEENTANEETSDDSTAAESSTSDKSTTAADSTAAEKNILEENTDKSDTSANEKTQETEEKTTADPSMEATVGEVALSGSCGDDVTFQVIGNQEGKYDLVISGNGEIFDCSVEGSYNMNAVPAPWADYRDTITKIQINQGVTVIGEGAFWGCTAVNTVSIPDSVTTIEYCAFFCCSSIKSLTLPGHLTDIGVSAFTGCSSLESIVLPESVTVIGGGAFNDCLSLRSINIPDGVTAIEYFTFYGCSSLNSISIPLSVRYIGSNTFSGCSLTDVYYEGTQAAWNKIANYDQTMKSLSADKIHFEGVERAACGKNVTYQLVEQEDATYKLVISGSGKMYSYGMNAKAPWSDNASDISAVEIEPGVTSIGDYAFAQCGNITGISIPDGVTTIGENAFSRCSSLTSVNVPETVTSIGRNAFSYCYNLTEIDIPESVSSIGANAFAECESLTEISIPASVTAIADSTFYRCTGLETISIPASVKTIGQDAFYKCTSLTSLELPEGLETIGSRAFASSNGLTSINIPESVTFIADKAFQGCSSLTGIRIPDGITSISEYTFSGCSSLTAFEIPENVTEIGKGAFSDCRSLVSISLPDGISAINNYSFSGCSNLESITIPDSVTSIGGNAFENCGCLTNISIPETVKSIGSYAFKGCNGLETITIPEGVTCIEARTFDWCSALQSIHIPRSLTYIAKNAFSNGGSLSEIFFEGTLSVWQDIFCEDDTIRAFSTSQIHFGEFESFACGDDLEYQLIQTGDFKYTLVISGTGSMYTYNYKGIAPWNACASGITCVKIEEGVTSIGDYAFRNCPNLTEVRIPESVTSIYKYSFSYSPDAVIYGIEGSYAEEFAASMEIPFVDVEALYKVSITSQPQSVSAGVNAKISYSISAKNAASYQWQYSKNGGAKWINSSAAAGGNTDTINVTVSASNAANIYRCVVTGINGNQVISETAGVELLPGAVITLNPASNAVAIGEYATFTVETENAAAFQWQYSKDGAHWYKSGAEGNTTDTLIVKGEQKSQGNRYRCVVTGIDGNTKKSYMAAMIVMTEAPKTCTAAVGEMASYSLKAEGIESYQWQYSKDNGQNWYKSSAEGATTDTVTFKATEANRQMIYRCKLTTPDEATAFTKPVGFAEGLKITEQPVSVSASLGEQASFTVTAENVAENGYQWQYSKDGVKWSNSGLATAKTNSITVTVAEANKNNVYRCKLTGTDGTVQYTEVVGVQ